MSKWHGGKGSDPRPKSVDSETFANNWDAIFGKKPHPELKSITQEILDYEKGDELTFHTEETSKKDTK